MTSLNVPLPDWAVVGAAVVAYSGRRFDRVHLVPLRIVRLTSTQIVTDSRDPNSRSNVRRWKWNHNSFREFGSAVSTWSISSELMHASDPRVAQALLAADQAHAMRRILRTVEQFTDNQTVSTAQAAIEALHRYLSINSTTEPKDSTS